MVITSNIQSLSADEKENPSGSSKSARCKSGLIGSAALLLTCFCLSLTLSAIAKPTETPVPAIHINHLAPLATGEDTQSLHAPFADGDCSLCHLEGDPKAPGPLLSAANEICLGCHEDFAQIVEHEFSHAAAKESCVNCHNPHNAKYTKLLLDDIGALCLSCHSEMKSITTQAKVKHDATINDKACINCHNSHGTDVEHLLISLPFDLCVTCHGQDGVIDHNGRQLINFKKLLADNPEHHGPVADKDCSACHNPHGAEYSGLLNLAYPPQFYSSYDPTLYALCFECHDESIFEEPKTKTLTLFRNGDVNLHYLHVNKKTRGRTCRACHEVHASKQKHQIRDGVPYGSKGWILKINYTPTPFGGTCAKTCHDTKSYTNRITSPVTVPRAGK
jgi:predicted CXXCH cytochrome family protein